VNAHPFVRVRVLVLVHVLVIALGCGDGTSSLPDVSAAPDAAVDAPRPADVPTDLSADLAAPEPVRLDLVPFARLRASATRSSGALPWPFEAQDAVATVRDGHDFTGWKPPADTPAAVEIDLQPLLGRAIAVGPLSLGWTGAAPSSVSVALAPG